MRSVANPRFYVHPELRIATDEGREERFSLRRLVLGMGQEEGAFGGLIDFVMTLLEAASQKSFNSVVNLGHGETEVLHLACPWRNLPELY